VPFLEDREQLRRWYHSFAIFLVPSVHESFGLVTAEGMACGCAVVTTRTGFGSDLKDREEAVLLPRATPDCLYEGVRHLLVSDALRRQVARGGHRRVQLLRWGPAIARLEDCYRTWRHERMKDAR
jgi:glycosyltransferase involved in cell wall biosynthesis